MASFRMRLLATAFTATVLALAAGFAAADPPLVLDRPTPAAFDKPLPETVDELKAIQEHVKLLAEKVMPAVVNIRADSQGSGVIISEDGYVLTAGHVSGKPGRDCTVTFPDGKKVKGRMLGQNVGADSGLIKIMEEGKYPYCEMGKSGDMKKGQWVVTIGHPGGYKQGRMPPVRLGRVSSPAGEFITTDCTLVGGDSGGPLFDMNGRVVGIHSRIGNALTANMHVPVDIFRTEWDRLAKSESWGGKGGGKGGKDLKAAPGRLSGVELESDGKEVKVVKIEPGSPAEKSGLKVNDIVLAVNGNKVASLDNWRTEIQRGKAGDEVTFEVRRGQETLKLKASLDKLVN